MGSGGGGGSSSFGRPTGPGTGDGSPKPKPQGTGTGGGGAGGGGGGGSADDCDSLDVVVVLQSPQPKVVAKLGKGDILEVKLTGGKPPIQAVTDKGDVAGAIVPPDIQRLVDCLKKGKHFVAEVLQISGGAVKVRVHKG